MTVLVMIVKIYFLTSFVLVGITILKNLRDFLNGEMGLKNFFLNILIAPVMVLKEIWELL